MPELSGELLVLGEVLAMAREPEKARSVEAFAERRLLRRILRLEEESRPATVAIAAATAPSRGELARLRAQVLDSAITLEPPGTAAAPVAAIRNRTGLAIAGLRVRVPAVYGSFTFTCDLAPGQPAIAPSGVGRLACSNDDAEAGPDAFARELENRRGNQRQAPPVAAIDLHFAPDGYRLMSGGHGSFPSQRDAAIERVRSAKPAERLAPSRNAREAVIEVWTFLKFAWAAFIPVGAGLVAGLVVGMRSERPVTAWAVSFLTLTVIGLIGAGIALFKLPWPTSLGSLESQWGLLFLLFYAFVILVMAAIAWVMVMLGMTLGISMGSRLRRSRRVL